MLKTGHQVLSVSFGMDAHFTPIKSKYALSKPNVVNFDLLIKYFTALYKNQGSEKVGKKVGSF